MNKINYVSDYHLALPLLRSGGLMLITDVRLALCADVIIFIYN